ncbi:xaa-Pro aminopeptidase 1-like [Porites lutea]|uniref:xaa-Pro aminopeptidase 1-like n=1 Tax=Porites lutea TaxID=51062 RepID=UPI003CC66746
MVEAAVIISAVILSVMVTTGVTEIPDDFTGSFQDQVTEDLQQRICSKHKPQFLPRTSVNTTKRLSDLRSLMRKQDGGIQGYIVPSTDAHQTEDVAPQHRRREFISGFRGSRGTAVITNKKAALWTDGRYFVQANMELDCNWILQKEEMKGTPSLAKWISQNIPKGSKVGVDPFLFSICEWDRLSKELKKHRIRLIPIKQNLIDLIWKRDRPKPVPRKLIVLDLKYSGKCWQDKISALRKLLKERSSNAVVLHKLDEIAWLFNLRGFDLKYSPVFFSYAVVTNAVVMLFVDNAKVTSRVRKHLRVGQCPKKKALCVLLKPYNTITTEVKRLAKNKHAKIWLSTSLSHGIRMNILKDKLFLGESPIALPKALKNPTEINGMKNANVKDSVAMCEFFAWTEQEILKNSTQLTELVAETKLLYFKSRQDNFISPSFATIAGFGSNSAIIHYKANRYTNAKINSDGVFLLDNGGQYLGGTTDTTRTVHFGAPSQHQKDCYTRVLKGHIDIANAVFPNDTYGRTLDVFAREPLWKIGLDYRHGTGHGIGHFLNVHEGPQCIAPGFPIDEEKILMPGMILSDEPGYYEDGKFGIRLETAVLVQVANTKYHFDGHDYLKFEPVTYMPFQRKLIDVSMLSKPQVDWLNEYHRKTRQLIGGELRKQGKMAALSWLWRETEPLDCKK